jgi:hypothetical protein
MAPLAAVELDQLLDVVWVSLVAGVTVTTTFSFVVLFAARSHEARRSGEAAAATAYGALALLTFLVFAAVVVVGVRILLTK